MKLEHRTVRVLGNPSAWLPLAILALAGCSDRAEEALAARAAALPEPADACEANIRPRALEGAVGMSPEETLRGELAQGATSEHMLILRRGACYRIFADAPDGVTDVDLLLYSPEGVLLQRAASGSASPALGLERPVCPSGVSGSYRLSVHMNAGAGAYCVQVWTSGI